MRNFLLGFALLAVASTTASAQWTKDGRPAADSASHKVKDGLAAYVALVPRPIQVLEEFSSAPPGQVPTLALVESVSDGEEFGAVVLVAGCDDRSNDGCRLTVTYTVFRPDGTLYSESTRPARQQGVSVAQTATRPAQAFLKLQFSVHDQRGVYRVAASVTDTARGITLDLETTVLLEESLPAATSRPN